MPTLNYKLDTECTNCGHQEEINIPHGSTFIEYEQIVSTMAGVPIVHIDSGYHKNYNKAKKKTIKRCSNCRCAALIKRG